VYNKESSIMVKAINLWFDQLPDPNRLYVYVLIVLGWVPFSMMNVPIISAIGGVWFIVAAVFVLIRILGGGRSV
jgi:hypothetical protein